MLADHVAVAFGAGGWNLLPFDAGFLRCAGRISFPIFAFCLVNGWRHTKNRANYLRNVALCAILSQIPYSLALYVGNRSPIASGECVAYGEIIWAVLPAALLAVLAYRYFSSRKPGWGYVAAACLLPALLGKVGGIWFLAEPLNVLYTFLLGAAFLFVIDQVRAGSLSKTQTLWLTATLLLATVVYGLRADYGTGLLGLALILGLYAAGQSKRWLGVVLLLWSVLCYGAVQGNWSYAVSALFAAVPVLLYDGLPGPTSPWAKRLFYVFYPAHLLLLGLANVYLQLCSS